VNLTEGIQGKSESRLFFPNVRIKHSYLSASVSRSDVVWLL